MVGYSTTNCTGSTLMRNDEWIIGGCQHGYEMEKCVEPGYLVKAVSYNGDIVSQTATPLEKCYTTTSGSSMATGIAKNETHYSYTVNAYSSADCSGTMTDMSKMSMWKESDGDMLAGVPYTNKYWYAHTLKDSLDLNLLRANGNDKWNNWATLASYGDNSCSGQPHTIAAYKQLCNGGFTHMCMEAPDRMEITAYNDASCSSQNGNVTTYNAGDCTMIAPGVYSQANCYFKGQKYWDGSISY